MQGAVGARSRFEPDQEGQQMFLVLCESSSTPAFPQIPCVVRGFSEFLRMVRKNDFSDYIRSMFSVLVFKKRKNGIRRCPVNL